MIIPAGAGYHLPSLTCTYKTGSSLEVIEKVQHKKRTKGIHKKFKISTCIIECLIVKEKN